MPSLSSRRRYDGIGDVRLELGRRPSAGGMGSCSLPSFPLSTIVIPLTVMLAPLLAGAASSNELLVTICSPAAEDYSANSTFQSNLRRLLSSLAAADVPASGFAADSVGSGLDTVYGSVVCRADVDAGACRGCRRDAADVVLRDCPRRKSAIVWYDYCMLIFKDRWTFPTFPPSLGDRTGQYVPIWNADNVTAADLPLFNRQVATMVTRLAAYVAYINIPSGRTVGTAEAAFTPAEPKIYGLAQCAPDQPAKICELCLTGFLRVLPTWSTGKKGAKILGTTCSIRYGTFRWFNGSAMVSIPSPGTAPAPAPALARPFLSDPENKGKRVKQLIAIIAGGMAVGLIIIVACISIWRQKASRKPHPTERIDPHIKSLPFNLTTLRVATNNFSNSQKLGEGGFGVVYKGILASGQVIAVKTLSERSKHGLKELRNEVELLAKQEHRNLVRLLGACMEEENLLVYEYVANKSLDKFLFDSTQRGQLIWQLRYKIIEGVARGLHYLHEESPYKIIHRDLKASNILLDVNMNPKISDFGISRLFPSDQTHVSTSRVVGTFGYMAPEYVINGQFSKKSDVFSFGVLLLEIVTGRRNSSFSHSEGSVNLLSYVWEHWTGGAMREIIDPSLGNHYEENEVARCIQTGLLCVQQVAADRPTMSSVVLMLSGLSAVTIGLIPQRPAFCPDQSEIGRHPAVDPSTNELSFSVVDPR